MTSAMLLSPNTGLSQITSMTLPETNSRSVQVNQCSSQVRSEAKSFFVVASLCFSEYYNSKSFQQLAAKSRVSYSNEGQGEGFSHHLGRLFVPALAIAVSFITKNPGAAGGVGLFVSGDKSVFDAIFNDRENPQVEMR